MSRIRVSHLALALALSLAAPLASAIDRDQAAARAQQSTGGRVLAVDKTEHDGRPVFKVRILTPSGDVRIVTVDGKTGAIR